MKKIIISMLTLVCSLSLMAAETAYVQIKLVGTSYPSFSTSKLSLMEDTERNATYESGYDSQSMGALSNDYSVLLYGMIGSQKCSTIATDNLDGLEIGFTTNNVDNSYTLSFVDFSGRELTLLDRVTNEVITINASTPAYAFSVEAAQVGRVAINDRFVIGGTQVVSFCFNYNVLEVMGHAGESLVIKQGETEIENVAALGASYSKDLSAYKGRLVVTLNGKDYQIDANPAVTVVP